MSAPLRSDSTGAGGGFSIHWVRDVLRFFYPYIGDDGGRLALMGGLSLAMVAANAVLIWMFGRAASDIASGAYASLGSTFVAIGLIVLINQAINLAYSYLYHAVSLRFVDRVRGTALEHIMVVSYPILAKFEKGDLMARLNGDVDALLSLVVNIPLQVFSHLVVTVVYLSLLVWMDWRLTAIVLLMAPVFLISQRYVAPRIGDASQSFTQERARLQTVEEQALSNLRGISAFNGQAVIRMRHQSQFDIARSWAFKLQRIGIDYNAVWVVLMYIAGMVVVYCGVLSIQSGRMSIAELVSFLIFARYLVQPLSGLVQTPMQCAHHRASAQRVMEIMNTAPIVVDSAAAAELAVPAGRIEFEQVTFSYPERERPVFRDLRLTIEAGETVALVGPSGSGKSTLAGLLLRFFDPQQGSIRVDGTDIRSVSLRSLRAHISIVWQAPYIFDGSIRANLLLAKPDATEQQMIAACKSSYADEFIDKLDRGLDAVIGAYGTSLSVGQIQRIAIAQAFLRDTPILILDEASSALDSDSEQRIVEALQVLRRHRTTLTIAHRYSTVRAAHRVIHLNGDGTVTSGTHAELMASHPMYQSSVAWQTAQQ